MWHSYCCAIADRKNVPENNTGYIKSASDESGCYAMNEQADDDNNYGYIDPRHCYIINALVSKSTKS